MKRHYEKFDSRVPSTERRGGLATLEMVLCLPILLMLMALMVNYGTVACWKIRSLSMARESLWSTRWPRTGNTNPRPDFWPADAATTVAKEDNIAELDDARTDLPVARGPLPFGTEVDEELLDPGRGLRKGSARISRAYPMLGSLGKYELHANTYLLDDKWQHQRMGMINTRMRRIPIIYALSRANMTMSAAYTQAVLAILNAPFANDLRPMDDDEEYPYYGHRFGWGGRSPDFYPRLRRFCSLDPEVATERVEQHVDLIQGKVERDAEGEVVKRSSAVAERMAQSFIRLYQRVIGAIESGRGTEPLPPNASAEITALEAKIDALEQFIQMLRNN